MDEHRPVMPDEAIRYLNCRPGGVYVDGTLGGGGHAKRMLEESSPDGIVIGLDVDGDAIVEAERRLAPFGKRAVIVRENYKNMGQVLKNLGIRGVDGVLLDLGVSSYQLESPERGFSFAKSARLDMRMDRRSTLSAYEIVNGYGVDELERIFRVYGEQKRARAVARAIERERKKEPIETTVRLANIIEGVLKRPSRIHSATRVFQAIRIAVNDEMENLKAGLEEATAFLKNGGRLVVITFHSLEDRIVKNTFRTLARGCVCPADFPRCVCGKKPQAAILTKKPVAPTVEEMEENPRSRSAKLRAVEKRWLS